MFDIGFTEIVLIGVVALLVVGPERLPAMVRTVAVWVGRMRRYVAHVRADIERELHAEELRDLVRRPAELDVFKKIKSDVQDAVDETRAVVSDSMKRIDEAEKELQDDLRALESPSSSEDSNRAALDTSTVDESGPEPAAAKTQSLPGISAEIGGSNHDGENDSQPAAGNPAAKHENSDGGPQRELDLFEAGERVSTPTRGV